MEHKVMQLKKWKEKIGGNPGLIIIGAFVILSILAAADHLFNLPRFFFGAPLESFEWEELVFDVIAIFSIGWISFVLIRKSEAGRGKIEQVFQIQRDLSLSLSGVTDLKEGLSLCLEAALDLSGMDSGGIYLLEQTTGSLNLAFHKGLSSDFVKVVSHYEAESPNVRLVMQGNPVYAQYQKIDLILTETERNEGLLALAVIPIKHESKIIGCFNIASRSAEEIPYFARQSLEMIAEQTGSSIARLRMEKELHESEERFRQFSENIEQVFWLTDWDAKRLLFVNPAFERLYGRSCQSAYDNRMNWQDVIHPEDRDRVRQAFARSADLGQYVEAEYRVVRDDGTVSWVLDRSYPVRDKDGRIYRFASVAEDITERKQTEEALRESEEKYKALIEAAGRAGEGIIIVQDNGDGEAAFVFVNDEFCRMSGYSREELLGRSAWGLVPAEVSIRLKDWYKRRHMGESLPGHYEAAGIRKDGAVVPLDLSIVTMPWQGKIATVLYLRDITERKKAEEEIRAERDKLENVTRNIGVGLAIISKDYRTIWANEVLKQIFGEVEGKLCFQTYNLREDICPGCGVKEVFEKEKDVSVHEQVGRDKDGNTIWSQIIATPLKDKEGNITAAMEVVVPITERKKAEEAQKESEERYRNFFENAPLGIYRTTPDGQILLANPALIRMLGFSSLEELAQRNLEKEGFEPQYRREEFKKHLEKEGEVQGLEAAWVRSDGSTIFVRENARAVKKEDGSIQYYEGMVEDITEHKKAEEALRSSEERHRLLFERNLAGVFRGTEDGKMLDCNESVVRMFGYDSKEELLSHQILDVYPEKKEREKFLSNLMKQKVLINYEVCFKRKDGSLFWGIENASLLEDKDQGYSIIEGTLIDITERKKAEEAVRESEQRYRGVVDNIGIGVSLISPNMKILFLNEQMKKWFPNADLSKEAICYRAFNSPPKEEICSYCPTDKTLHDGQIHESITETPVEGKIINYRVISSPIKDLQGKVTAAIEMVEDITEKKRLQEQLIQSEKLAAVGTLAYGIAHEFNNILAGMMANAELGLISKEQEQIKECFEIIVDNSHRASSITSNLLAFARQKEARKELIDITEPLKSILAITRRELEKCNIEIIEKFKLVPKIYCDPGQFSEVFLNMITNARDAMHPKGGTLTIQVEPGDDNIHIVFEDTGCGIPEEIKGKIFEPFVTTKGALGKSEVPGTGLGLFLTYGIVNGYKGKIEVESVVGKGTRFSIIIPIAENQPREFLLDTQIESSRETEKKLKILLVDDEKAITLGLKKFLESKGHKVSTSLRAKGGLEIFRKGRFDLVLSDITIPDMDGIELIKKMKENDQQVKIIVITGHLQKEKEEKARQAGADEVLIKPFKNELLYQTISKIVI
jgi:two-component system cell cycle sensor histidine kinase/response regulator CckA